MLPKMTARATQDKDMQNGKIRAAQTSSTGQHLACMICMLWQFRQFQSQAAQCRQTSGPNQFQKLGRRQFQLQSRLGQGLSKRLQRCRRCRLVVTSMLLKTHLVLQTLWKLQIASRYWSYIMDIVFWNNSLRAPSLPLISTKNKEEQTRAKRCQNGPQRKPKSVPPPARPHQTWKQKERGKKKIKGKEGKSSREQKRVNYDGTRST